MNSQDMISRLESKGIRPTANRILVMKPWMGEQSPQSLSNLEREKSYRWTSRASSVPLPSFWNIMWYMPSKMGEGVLCYELCEEKGACDHHDGHIHFYCESCQRSFCIEGISIFQVSSCPKAFTPTLFPLSSKANAPDCRKKHQ